MSIPHSVRSTRRPVKPDELAAIEREAWAHYAPDVDEAEALLPRLSRRGQLYAFMLAAWLAHHRDPLAALEDVKRQLVDEQKKEEEINHD